MFLVHDVMSLVDRSSFRSVCSLLYARGALSMIHQHVQGLMRMPPALYATEDTEKYIINDWS